MLANELSAQKICALKFMHECSSLWCCDCLQIRPLEETYKFGAFFSSYLNESDFSAKPSVLLLGQYSTGTVWGLGFEAEDLKTEVYLAGWPDPICAMHYCVMHVTSEWPEPDLFTPSRLPRAR